jgi:hypothetical protein
MPHTIVTVMTFTFGQMNCSERMLCYVYASFSHWMALINCRCRSASGGVLAVIGDGYPPITRRHVRQHGNLHVERVNLAEVVGMWRKRGDRGQLAVVC